LRLDAVCSGALEILSPAMLRQQKANQRFLSLKIRRYADREKIATQLTDLETAERVLTRVSTTPSARSPRSAAAALST
jgi:hypothetical protein